MSTIILKSLDYQGLFEFMWITRLQNWNECSKKHNSHILQKARLRQALDGIGPTYKVLFYLN